MRPFILNHAVLRKGDNASIFEYDYAKSLNIIDVDGVKIPFIDAKLVELSLLTKTKTANEADDENPDMLELTTKTERSRERDDHHSALLELQTKTFSQRELDDQ